MATKQVGSQRGFTLIELLVVIAIIGLLSSVVLASLNAARERARDARRMSDVRQIILAFELYYDANGRYPASSSSYLNDIAAYVVPAYMPELPVDPTRTSPWTYRLYGDGAPTWQTYTILVDMENDGDNNFCKVNHGAGYPNWQIYVDCDT